MRFTTLTDYALPLPMYLARRPDRLCTIAVVAGSYGVREAHMMKITHRLGLAGWIETVRGKGGGMRLAQAPQDIRLGAVVRSMERDFFMVECFSTGNACVLTGNCKLTAVIEGALQNFIDCLDGSTPAEVLPAPLDPSATQAMRMTKRIGERPA